MGTKTTKYAITEHTTNNLQVSDDLSWIVPVWVGTQNSSNETLVYALIDSMSNTSYVTDDVVAKLQPLGKIATLKMTTLTSKDHQVNTNEVSNLTIRAYNDKKHYLMPMTYSLPTLPMNKAHIPNKQNLSNWPHLVKVAQELPDNHKAIPVGLLIGSNFPQAFKPQDIITTKNEGEPFAMKTTVGWLVMGDTYSNQHNTFATLIPQPRYRSVVTFQCTSNTSKQIDKLINIFGKEFQDAYDDTLSLSVEDKQFLSIMKANTKLKEGRVTMPLPFRAKPLCGNTKSAAFHRFKLLEKKFQYDNNYKLQYHNFMNDIITRGEAIPSDSDTDESWYISHFGVFHPKKPDKIRVVFDCAAKVGGISLNDFLLQGPEHINDLQGILIRFRVNPVAIMGDIERMFHQFKVPKEHQKYLKFFWYNAEGIPTTYKMCVHLFGARSSPACATYGLRYLADTYQALHPESKAPQFIHKNFYVDDGLASVASPTETITLIKETQNLCASGKLRMHKFISNSRDVMMSIPKIEHSSSLQNIDLHHDNLPQERSLGVVWDTQRDTFTFKFNDLNKPNTRRGLLSTVASVFDPLGLIAPITLTGRMLLQEVCKTTSDWDAPLNGLLLDRWQEWKMQMATIDKLQIPRCLTPCHFQQIQTAELHTFADASTNGYGQCSYLRLVDTAKQVHVSLLASKARVAPLKPMTVPRLELQAAVGAVKLAKKIQDEIGIPNLESYHYSDSTVVLGYIANITERYHTFVANRIETIRALSDIKNWKWVPTNENPADLASRGSKPDSINHTNWFSGPEFLLSDTVQYLEQPNTYIEPNDPEIKQASTFMTIQTPPLHKTLDQKLERYSSWNRAVKHIAILQQKILSKSPSLDFESAKRCILLATQREYFLPEIQQLKCNKPVAKSSHIYKLDPFIDDKGLLRVGGRLQESPILSLEEKHPILLPKHSHTTLLLIKHYHELVAHQGREATLARLRTQGFWIIKARSVVYSHIHRCVICKKIRGKPQTPQMATLPEERTINSAPFTHCGMDCFGPFLVKDGRKEKKAYGLIVTCLASRAVNLELLEDMSTDSFINALRSTIAFRGHISSIRCDQGTNFVGAFNELAKHLQGSPDFSRMRFIFNPPHASNMGGVWERLIRSARNIMKGLSSKYSGRLSTCQLRTLLHEVMAIINSRPLGSVAEDGVPLTPNRLLTMKSKVTIPPPGEFSDSDVYSRKRWRVVQQLANQFWKRWRSEYLQTLQVRQKWIKKAPEVSVDDIVLVSKDSLRNDWSLARVLECFKSHDGVVRSVRLMIGSRQYPTGVTQQLTRPVNKIVVLIRAAATDA